MGTTSLNKGRSVCSLTNSNEHDNSKICGIYGNLYSQLPSGTLLYYRKDTELHEQQIKVGTRKTNFERRPHLSMNLVQLLSPLQLNLDISKLHLKCVTYFMCIIRPYSSTEKRKVDVK